MTKIRRTVGTIFALSLCSLASGDAGALAPSGRYTYPDGTVQSSQTVYDTVTKLMWQRAGGQTSMNAASYCAGLSLGGYSSGWRLPTAKELASIVDVSTSNPAIDGVAFPNTPSNYFWTSTPGTGFSYVVFFYDGEVTYDGGADTGGIGGGDFNVRCVR